MDDNFTPVQDPAALRPPGLPKKSISPYLRILAAIILLAIGAAAAVMVTRRTAAGVAFETPYQAVLLSNGSVYFGKLQGLGTAFPVLTDVFYVQNVPNPETKQNSTVLVKRGKELHSPSRMLLNASQIVLVEPVGANSRVAQLIEESRK
jgi:hypothetical protein